MQGRGGVPARQTLFQSGARRPLYNQAPPPGALASSSCPPPCHVLNQTDFKDTIVFAAPPYPLIRWCYRIPMLRQLVAQRGNYGQPPPSTPRSPCKGGSRAPKDLPAGRTAGRPWAASPRRLHWPPPGKASAGLANGHLQRFPPPAPGPLGLLAAKAFRFQLLSGKSIRGLPCPVRAFPSVLRSAKACPCGLLSIKAWRHGGAGVNHCRPLPSGSRGPCKDNLHATQDPPGGLFGQSRSVHGPLVPEGSKGIPRGDTSRLRQRASPAGTAANAGPHWAAPGQGHPWGGAFRLSLPRRSAHRQGDLRRVSLCPGPHAVCSPL